MFYIIFYNKVWDNLDEIRDYFRLFYIMGVMG